MKENMMFKKVFYSIFQNQIRVFVNFLFSCNYENQIKHYLNFKTLHSNFRNLTPLLYIIFSCGTILFNNIYHSILLIKINQRTKS